MPHLQWVHNCSASKGSKVRLGEKVCRTCGAQGDPDGIGFTGIEAQGDFQRFTGLPSIGPHKTKLPNFSLPCSACDGKGVRVIQQHSRWVSCKCCNGIGSVITVSEEKFILIQKEAWSIFDAWSLERAGESRKHEITKRQKDRSYKGIFKRDHYAPKRSKRTIRYFEKVNRLMSLSIDPDCSEEILAEWENLFVSNVSRSEEKCGVHK
ncbi:MAG: hypothetical protein HOD11_14645 [Candidatus Marinimicrobia bacterium]|nr:hypothetical protein [Candidatus Neomarinimicrobiota bacterium]